MKYWRINLILLFVMLFGAALIGRLVYIQILNHDFYKALAQGQQKFFGEIEGERGEIFLQDKKGNLYSLAINKDWQMVYASPQEIKEKESTAEKLAQILDLEKDLVLEKLNKEDSFFEMLKNKLSESEISQLEELGLKGIHLKKVMGRYYPQEFLASSVVGFVGGQGIGQYGLEGYYESALRGEEKFQEGGRNAWIDLLLSPKDEPKKGSDIILTIDYNIQSMAERLLKETKENLDIESGQIIAIEPSSGKILAMANLPNFNPNYYFQEEEENFQNRAIYWLFEPGSIFKAITMAAALDKRVISPQTSYIDEGRLEIGDDTIYNYEKRVWGEKTMTEVLERSINTGAVFVERQLGDKDFLAYIDKFGIFQPTGIDLQEETFSQNKELKKGYEINYATASFGQGIEMTPVQIVRAYCAVINGGKMIKPYVVEEISDENNESFEEEAEIMERQVISSSTSSKLTAMLVSVVENGYAKGARIPGYYIGGKTGTAQVPEKGVYSPDKTWQTFIGFAPAFEPKFLILVKLDNPKTRTAEYSALPVFHDLAKYIIDYYQIPSDYE
ncbi:penicillin-binding protein 2 [Candidatus Parcubacteria bacterium]|nr:penicillin-binding protein 2 [Candidatus Parcubacteria bacterium]